MRTLSIQQPWAWLIIHAGKDIENRSWETPVRGPIQVHTGKVFDHMGYDTVRTRFPDIEMPLAVDFDRGGIVGMVEIVDCVTASDSQWFCGPYGFVLENPIPIDFRRYSGQLGWFDA